MDFRVLITTAAPSFASAFASEGVAFDPVSGSFKFCHPERGSIDVIGEGVTAMWTVRALERQGYHVNLGRNGSAVQVICEGEKWELVSEKAQNTYFSIVSLTNALQKL